MTSDSLSLSYVRYFSVRESAPSSGSFVRETKIRGGTSLIEGVRSRFVYSGESFRNLKRYSYDVLRLPLGTDRTSKIRLMLRVSARFKSP